MARAFGFVTYPGSVRADRGRTHATHWPYSPCPLESAIFFA